LAVNIECPVQSKTYNVFLFFRTIMAKGENGPDPKPAVALAEQTRVYPLWAMEKDVRLMQFPNGSGKRVNMMYPFDNTYWAKLKAFVDYEPISAIDPELRGALASIGIIKGQPFNPTAKQQELLKKAVETAPKMIMAMRQLGRPDGRQLYYKDRQYENVWAGATSEWLQESYLDVNQRTGYFQIAYSTAPAMVMRTLAVGSKYPVTARDANGDFLNGSSTYKLRLPPNPPAAPFWAVTAYNITDGTMPETPQLLPSKRLQQGRDKQRWLNRYLVRPREACQSCRVELDSDRQRTGFHGRVAPLWHRRRVLRPELEA
jgi:hypothetical protein